MNVAGGFGARAERIELVAPERTQKPFGHVAAAGIPRAEE
jgi:hypothetical protein